MFIWWSVSHSATRAICAGQSSTSSPYIWLTLTPEAASAATSAPKRRRSTES